MLYGCPTAAVDETAQYTLIPTLRLCYTQTVDGEGGNTRGPSVQRMPSFRTD